MRQLKIGKSITNRDSASLEKYLHEISGIPLIDSEREIELARSIKKGPADPGYQSAFKEMVQSNLRFVVSVSKQYQNQGLSLPDLINEGNLGLIKAAQRFDETRGFKFISYAVWWIRQSILQAICEQARIVRLPLNKIGARNKVNKAIQQLEQQYEREPTDEEIVAKTNLGLEEVRTAAGNNMKHASLDFQPGGEDGETPSNMYEVMENTTTPKPDGGLMDKALIQEIDRALSKLSTREADVVKLFYGLNERRYGQTLEEIGDMYGLTRERVRQIKEKAIRKLRHGTRSKLLRSFLG